MPYRTNADLPAAVRNALPSAAQSIFRSAFNNAAYNDMPEERAMAIAWGAVKNAGYKKGEGGKWVKAKDAVAEDEEVLAFRKFEADAEDVEEQPVPWAAADGETVEIRERVALDAKGARVRKLADGYMVAYPRIARTGIQIYKGIECGRSDLDEVRVYRPESEVFSKDALRSFAHRPVTSGHPAEMVNADNWRKHAAGYSGDEVLRDGKYIRVPMMLMDGTVIRDVENGIAELSAGYTMDLKWVSGQTEDGDEYDAVQTRIRANHLAIVPAARGGPELRIGDKGEAMTTKKIVVDAIPLEVPEMAAQIIERAIERLNAELVAIKATAEAGQKDAKSKDEKIAELTAISATKDAEIATLKQQVKDAALKPEALDALVKERAEVVDKARRIIGDKLVIQGKTVPEIRRQVVDAKLGDIAKAWTDDQVRASFDTFSASGPSGRVALDDVLSTGPDSAAQDKVEEAYDAYCKDLSQAWKNPKGVAH